MNTSRRRQVIAAALASILTVFSGLPAAWAISADRQTAGIAHNTAVAAVLTPAEQITAVSGRARSGKSVAQAVDKKTNRVKLLIIFLRLLDGHRGAIQ